MAYEAAGCGSQTGGREPTEPSLNRRNIFVDFLAREAAIVTCSLDSDGEPLTVHQHCLEGPAVVESDISVDDLLDGAWH